MKLFLLIPCLFLLSACPGRKIESNLKYVQPKEIMGTWVNPCVAELCAFALVDFDERAQGKLIISVGGELALVGDLENFRSRKYNFEIELAQLEGLSEEDTVFEEGMGFIGHARLGEICFDIAPEVAQESDFLCFVKVEELNQNQTNAYEKLKSIKIGVSHNKFKNEDASDAGTDAAKKRRPF